MCSGTTLAAVVLICSSPTMRRGDSLPRDNQQDPVQLRTCCSLLCRPRSQRCWQCWHESCVTFSGAMHVVTRRCCLLSVGAGHAHSLPSPAADMQHACCNVFTGVMEALEMLCQMLPIQGLASDNTLECQRARQADDIMRTQLAAAAPPQQHGGTCSRGSACQHV
eukprot:jgi/Ulvmu1/7849/UM004_0080.1